MGVINAIKNLMIKDIEFKINYREEFIELIPNKKISTISEIQEIIEFYGFNIAENTVQIDYIDVYQLYYEGNKKSDLYQYFGLPDLFKGLLNVKNDGNYLVDEQVKYSFYFKDNYGIYNTQINNIIYNSTNNISKILPVDIYSFLNRLKSYNTSNSLNNKVVEQFDMLKQIKNFSKDLNINVDQRILDEDELVILKEIKMDFDDDGETLNLYPIFDENPIINKQLNSKFLSNSNIKDFYSVIVNGKKIKYVLPNKEIMEKVKENTELKDENRLEFLSGKSELFTEEELNFENFSERVAALGYFQSRSSESSNENQFKWRTEDYNERLSYPNIVLNGILITLTPKDKVGLEKKLLDLNYENKNCCEYSFFDNEKEYKTVLAKAEIEELIKQINTSIKNIEDIENTKKLEEILEIYKKNKMQYLPFEGKYVLILDEEEINERIEFLNEKSKGTKTLIAKNNLEELEYIDIIDEELIGIEEAEIPNSLKDSIQLYEFQKNGLKKLQSLYLKSRNNGILLCDDMGLGKTIQILTFLGWLKERGDLSIGLIVAPTSLLKNWDDQYDGEIQKFFEDDTFHTYHMKGRIDDYDLYEIENADLVFTTYTTLRINSVKLANIKWSVIICDEAQKIKNPNAMVSNAIKIQNSEFKIACTATPIENSLIDLWNLVDFVKPGLLNSLKHFKSVYMSKKNNEDINNSLKETIDNYYIRREKDILPKELPKKNIKIYLEKATADEKNVLNRLMKTEKSSLALVNKLIYASSHISLVKDREVFREKPDELINSSTKLKITLKILEDIKRKDEKVLIFTRSIKMQKILFKAIKSYFNFPPAIINGRVSSIDKRGQLLNTFKRKNGFNVIILSPDVAGFGLTITEANHVIHYMRLWNPAKEDQATDRVYRIGQNKNVTVHYPILSFNKSEEYNFDNVTDYIRSPLINLVESPEEKLNSLLMKKKDMLLNFFLSGESRSIKLDDFSDNKTIEAISFEDIDTILTVDEYRRMIAHLFILDGFEVEFVNKPSLPVNVVAKKDNRKILVAAAKTYQDEDLEALKFYKNELEQKENKNYEHQYIVMDKMDESESIKGKTFISSKLNENEVFMSDIRKIKSN